MTLSKIEESEKIYKMIFPKEENPEKLKEKMIEKEQNAISDFVKNLDKEVYENFSNFPLKIPIKLTNPDSLKLDSKFILIKIQEDFYLFPKTFKKDLSDYLFLKKYIANNSSKYLDIKWIICMFIICFSFSLVYFVPIVLDYLEECVLDEKIVGLFWLLYVSACPFIILNSIVSALTYTDDSLTLEEKEKEFSNVSSSLQKFQFPLELQNVYEDIHIYENRS